MMRVHRAERADALADALGALLLRPLADPFAGEVVAVPAKGVERWLTQRLSGVLGAGTWIQALVATASVCVEVNDLEAAARDLDEAIEKAPSWAAGHYERGKLWRARREVEVTT